MLTQTMMNAAGQNSNSLEASSNPASMSVTNQQIAQIQRNNKKFVEMASKANSSMLAAQSAHQQMLLNQYNKAQMGGSNAQNAAK